MIIPRVLATESALALLAALKDAHGRLLFHQSGGCCDGSSPMCYPVGEFRIGINDVYLGEVGGCPFYIGGAQFDYWRHTQLTLDVVPGCGSSFSVEAPRGVRFMVRSRVFAEHELRSLPVLRRGPQW